MELRGVNGIFSGYGEIKTVKKTIQESVANGADLMLSIARKGRLLCLFGNKSITFGSTYLNSGLHVVVDGVDIASTLYYGQATNLEGKSRMPDVNNGEMQFWQYFEKSLEIYSLVNTKEYSYAKPTYFVAYQLKLEPDV